MTASKRIEPLAPKYLCGSGSFPSVSGSEKNDLSIDAKKVASNRITSSFTVALFDSVTRAQKQEDESDDDSRPRLPWWALVLIRRGQEHEEPTDMAAAGVISMRPAMFGHSFPNTWLCTVNCDWVYFPFWTTVDLTKSDREHFKVGSSISSFFVLVESRKVVVRMWRGRRPRGWPRPLGRPSGSGTASECKGHPGSRGHTKRYGRSLYLVWTIAKGIALI